MPSSGTLSSRPIFIFTFPLWIEVIALSATGGGNSNNNNNCQQLSNNAAMHLVSRAVWSLVGSLACLGVAVNAAGALEIDVVFPRNETYAPTANFPIVFAIRNAALAKHLNITIQSFIRNGSDLNSTFGHSTRDLANANFSSEPYFVYHYQTLDTEGPHELFSTAYWTSCNASSDPVSLLTNSSNLGVRFTIQKGAQQVDLVAATANDKTCSAHSGVAIGVTDQTLEYPASARLSAGTCAVLATSSPTPIADPCRVSIDSATAASMSASLQAALCKGLNPPAGCPKENNAVEQLAVVGVASFAAALGAIGLMLA
ncbi:hypothetical protein GE09DRAFT_1165127 [Coniochaeta sp. 2T2.1]|nr:hypothetical protein GE09DRAFT_1165127 [Coniochaeta sp. 2T2.1]